MTSFDNTILANDRRGISQLRPYVSSEMCLEAADFILEKADGCVGIVTGFYEIGPGVIETDGPPGAMALGRALAALGIKVIYVTDRFGMSFLADGQNPALVVEFPIADDSKSEAFARRFLNEFKPGVMIAVERCSVTARGTYLNMSSVDITHFTARTDYLFTLHGSTVGIGDGGNEIGMGGLQDAIRESPNLPDEPAATATTKLVIASVSNWGAYGVVAALSRRCGKDLLPDSIAETDLIAELVERGAVDGFYMKPITRVDGFTMGENSFVLESLRNEIFS